MVKTSKMERLYQSGATVFRISDLRVLWREDTPINLKSQVAYYVKQGKLLRLRRGIYALENYDQYELANKLIVPSYISLETALLRQGIMFQPTAAIMSLAPYAKIIRVGGREYRYYAMSTDMLLNPSGLKRVNKVLMAGTERAIDDLLYLRRQPDLANFEAIDQAVLKDIAAIYPGEQVKKRVADLLKRGV